MKRHPRILLKLGMFLLLGAIVNVAVAWGCALFLDPFSRIKNPFGDGDVRFDEVRYVSLFDVNQLGFHVRVYEPTMGTHLNDVIGEGPQTPWLYFRRISWEADQAVSWDATTIFDSRGFPCPALWSRVDKEVESPYRLSTRYAINSGRFNGTWTWVPKCLPLHPLWPGFAINTVFYAALLWVLWVSPGKIRRLVRIRRECCPACGFIIAPGTCANGLCSECGAALPECLRTQPT